MPGRGSRRVMFARTFRSLNAETFRANIALWTPDLIPARLGRDGSCDRQDRIDLDLSRRSGVARPACSKDSCSVSNPAHVRWCAARFGSGPACDSTGAATRLQPVSSTVALSGGGVHVVARFSDEPTVNSVAGDHSGSADDGGER